jgi:CO/xanthine dehydrogenase FAD-binding subunit
VMGYPDAKAASGYRFRLSLAAVAPVPLRLPEAEKVLAEKEITAETIAEAAQIAKETCTPIDDVRSCSQYRRYMSRNLMRQALTAVWEQLKK